MSEKKKFIVELTEEEIKILYDGYNHSDDVEIDDYFDIRDNIVKSILEQNT